MAVREEKRMPLYSVCQSKESLELENLLKHYGKKVGGDTVVAKIVIAPDRSENIDF